jgi:[ribosomal protein S18]-alanine N-acetyltransferase
MREWNIVPMQEEHLDALADVERLCFSHPWTRDGLKAELTSDTACFVSAEQGGVAVGCAGMHCICGECYIDKVAVHPACRRQGIAQALVQNLIDFALRNHAEFITLEVRESNASAIALYAKLGFQTVGLRKEFYTEPNEDALLMTRKFENDINL